MPLVKWHHISRAEVRKHLDWLFVFGDNMVNAGYGGQASACRGEKNCIGIPTKFFPTTKENAYFTDADYNHIALKWGDVFHRLEHALRARKVIVLPMGGVGTGRAQLQQRAPKLWALLQHKLSFLESLSRSLDEKVSK